MNNSKSTTHTHLKIKWKKSNDFNQREITIVKDAKINKDSQDVQTQNSPEHDHL